MKKPIRKEITKAASVGEATGSRRSLSYVGTLLFISDNGALDNLIAWLKGKVW
ncbi:hypothetical protein [Pseudodesulfovibrio piezophilus]|uniref:Uncharacterized protein n=1 Tax=Pseudodesulfovibrio piezophilus (strain DSM 21447 / JCM 15486 / C1TLV30) TaxID=1322246 RepID=M1WJP8_PSEP2|nr:hypothetical protein [Pseudodesulfovibrio piezophilus]CCH48271.1 protein of unknown function [Pseudodesulfovibrio piezophilus C1TLV30]